MLSAGSIGTEVKSEVTSYDDRHCCLVVLRPDEELSELESLSMTIKLCSVKEEKFKF